jgi:transcriptional regulator with GAF, ATPase, and Fis domain
VAVDRQMIARTVQELRVALPEADDLLAGLLRVAEATRTVLEVDGAGLTLVHADGPPRWVAATDAAMELLVQVQHDFGDGPYLQAYAQDRAVVVEDLGAAPAWVRLAAVVGQLHVCGVLSVPIRLVGQPVGTLDVYSTQPRAWTAHEMEGVAEFAAVAGELVHTSVELAVRELELAQLRQALTTGSGSSRPKGCWPPPRAPSPRRPSSGSASRLGRPRASWPRWPKRSSRMPSAGGWPPWPWTMPGAGGRGPRPGRRAGLGGRPGRPGPPP